MHLNVEWASWRLVFGLGGEGVLVLEEVLEGGVLEAGDARNLQCYSQDGMSSMNRWCEQYEQMV
jgi:hypothetical protein